MNPIFKILFSIISVTLLLSCKSKSDEEVAETSVRPVSISILHNKDTSVSDWLKASSESFLTEVAPSFTGNRISFSFTQQSTIQSIENLASGKEKADIVLLPNSNFANASAGKTTNLGASVSGCRDLIASPYVGVIPKTQVTELQKNLGRPLPDSDKNVISVTLKELGELLKKSRFSYENPIESSQGHLSLLLSIAAINSTKLSSPFDVSPDNFSTLQKTLDWYAPSDLELIELISSKNSSLTPVGGILDIGLLSERQIKTRKEFPDLVTILKPSDYSVIENQSLCISEADWVSPFKRSVVTKLQDYLSSPAIVAKAKELGFQEINHTSDNSSPEALPFSIVKPETTESFVREHFKPYSISVAIDTSSTMGSEVLNNLKAFAHKLHSKGPLNFEVLRFSSEVELLGDQNTTQKNMDEKLSLLTPGGGGSSIFDSIAKQYESLSRLPASDSRRLAVVFTDGNDKTSEKSAAELVKQISALNLRNNMISLNLILLSPAAADSEDLSKVVKAAHGKMYKIEQGELPALLTELEKSF